MAGNKLGIYKSQTGFGKAGYKPGSMISKMNKSNVNPRMTAGAGSGVGRIQKAGIKVVLKKAIKTTGKFHDKSNALGHGGRAAQLKAQGVPGGVIGNLARAAHTAPGQKNFHGKKKTAKYKHAMIAKEVKKVDGKKGIKALVKIQKAHVKGKIKA